MNSSWNRVARAALGLVLALPLVASCQQAAPAASVSPAVTAAASIAAPAAASDLEFTTWLEGARADAAKRGITPGTINQALTGIAPIERIIELDSRQPEFSNTFTRYINSAVSAKRVTDGGAVMTKHAKLLAELERQYGIPGRFLVAFWGLESNFGSDTGSYPVVNALATLAYEGRRGAFFKEEMILALSILDKGHTTLDKMKGSYAGAMGQTQFMPSTFLRYAVDGDHNGHADIWQSVPDALASTANYLNKLGWDSKRTWGREVRVPAGFDLRNISLDVDAKESVKSLSAWGALGVRRADGGALPNQDVQAALVMPAGAKGPAFLLYDNYRITLRYNRSAFYAIAIGHLADRVSGADGLVAAPRESDPLRREEVVALQEGLMALGFLKAADGVMGSGTRQGIRAFQLANVLTPDGYADRSVLTAVQNKAAGRG